MELEKKIWQEVEAEKRNEKVRGSKPTNEETDKPRTEETGTHDTPNISEAFPDTISHTDLTNELRTI
jgi:hypothetical protein